MSRPLLWCGVGAALLWMLGGLALRLSAPGQGPIVDPASFGQYAGSLAVRLWTLAVLGSYLLEILCFLGVCFVVQGGPGQRRSIFATVLLTAGCLTGAAAIGVPLFMYPRVSVLVARGILEAVDIVSVVPMGAVVAQGLPVAAGAALMASAVRRSRRLPGAAGVLAGAGLIGSVVAGSAIHRLVVLLVITGLWAGGHLWMALADTGGSAGSGASRAGEPHQSDPPAGPHQPVDRAPTPRK